MNIDSLLETVSDELGFPVSSGDLVDRFSEESIEFDSAETDRATPRSLREHLEDGPPTQSADARDREAGPPDRFKSRQEIRTYLMSVRD